MMNERIKELAKQAGFGEQWFEQHPTGCALPKPLMLKEYTELIVRECVSLFDGTQEMKTIGVLTHDQVVGQIKEHFGVE